MKSKAAAKKGSPVSKAKSRLKVAAPSKPRAVSAYREDQFSTAIKHWWKNRDKTRSGKAMDGFREILIEALVAIGVDKNDIYPRPRGVGEKLPTAASMLPSYYRASKNWDLLICKNSLHKTKRSGTPGMPPPQLIAAIEFKSQLDSIGKNQNNRVEESVGSAQDFWESYRSHNFHSLTPRPWLGYLFVGRYDDADLEQGVQIHPPHFPTDKAFALDEASRISEVRIDGHSYADRYQIFMSRLIATKLYDRTCFITTNEALHAAGTTDPYNYRCHFEDLSGAAFIDALLRHVSAYYFDGPPSRRAAR